MLGGTNSNSQLIKNLDVTLTENGTFVSGEDYTGFGTVTVAVPPDVMDAELKVTPTKEDGTSLDPTYDEYTGPFIDPATGIEYAGAGHIKVRKIGSWIDAEISADNIRKGHNILGVPGNVIELHGEEKIVKSTTYEQTIEPSEGKNGITKVTVSPVKYQNKTTNPTMTKQTVIPDNGYDAMSSVTVNAINFDYLKEQEPDLVADNIKKGVEIFTVVGTYEPNNQTKIVDPKTYAQDIHADTGYDGLSNVHVNAVTSSIDEDIKADNIRKDVNILGVTGTYEGRQPVITTVNESSVIEPKISEQIFTVPSDSDGFDSFKVNPVTSTIDANIKPSNIKRNVKILGVTGTYVTENLQDKVVNPTKQQQVVTYDDDVYDGLNSVTITGVTSTIDENIKAENIKKNVEILGVTGTYEETFSTEEKTVTPKTVAQSVTPSEGINGLSRVNVEGVTSAIDANILAENIKKGIEILGVTGNLEATHYNLQDGKIVEPQLVDRTYTADEGYDALLNILVKAVTASIDPNILPKNIKEGIKILGVTGELIEGEEQHWMDYRNIKSFNTMGETTLGGGSWSPTVADTCENIYFTFNDPDYNAKGINTGKVSATVFSLVMNYDNLEATDSKLEQIYIYFLNGTYYDTNFNLTQIKDQISYIYPVTNNFGINGCLLNSDDVATDKEYNLYVLINSSNNTNKPVLVDGTFATSMYPQSEFLNVEKVGNVVVDKNYVASGFESTSYVTPGPINFGNGTWEMVLKTKFKSGTDYQRICGTADNSSVAQIVMAVKSNNKLITWISSNGTGWNIASGVESNNTLIANTDYYIKAQFTGTNYILSLSTDGINYTEEINVSSSTVISNPNSNFWLGNAESISYAWQGSIYLKECYIKVNDAFIWKGVENGPLYDQNRYVGKLTIPAHIMFVPKVTADGKTHWVLKDRKGVESLIHVNENKPLTIDVSAYDKNFGEEDDTIITSHTVYPLTKDLLFYERSNELGNLVNYVDNGDAVDIKLYHTGTEGSMPADLSYPFEFDSTIDTSKLIDGSNFIINKNLNAITNGSKSWHVNSGSSYGYFKIHTPNESTTFSVTAYVSSEGNYDFGGCYVGTQIYNASRDAIKSTTTDGHGKWVFMNSSSSKSTYTTTLEANTDYYIQFYYTKDGSGDSGEDRIIIKNMKFSYYGKTNLYIFSPDENLGSEYQNVEYVDTISIPEHNIYINENNQWYPAKHITIDVDNADTTIYTEIEDKE